MAKNIVEIIIQAKDKASQVFRQTSKEAGAFERSISAVKTALAGLAAGLLANELRQFGVETFRAAAQADRLATATDNLAQAAGMAGDEIINGVVAASKGMIDQTTAAQAANKALLFGLIDNQSQMEELTRIAITLGNAMGQGAGKSIDDLTTALGRQSPLILDNLGITLKLEEAHRIYANQLGKTVEALTEEEKQQAFVNAALEKGRDRVEQLGGVSVDAAGNVDQLAASWANFYVEFGRVLTALNESTGAMDAANSAINRLVQGAQAWQGVIANVNTLQAAEARAAENLGIAVGRQNAAIKRGKFSYEQWQAAVREAHQELVEEERNTARAAATIEMYSNIQAEAEANTLAAAQAAREDAVAKRDEAIAAQYAADAQRLASQRAKQAALDNAQAQADQFARGGAFTGDEAFQQAQQMRQQLEDLDIGGGITSSFDSAANDLANTISSVIQPSLSEVWKPDQDTQNVDEWARRLATVATSGLGSEWTTQLQQQFGGQSFFQPVADAIAAGDNAGAMEAAKELLTNNVTALYDKDLIKQRVREKLQQEQLRDELIKEIQSELGAEGIAVSTGVIAGAAGDATVAQQEVQTELDNVGVAAEGMGEKGAAAFGNVKTGAEKLIEVLEKIKTLTGGINGDLESINQQGTTTANNFGVNPNAGAGAGVGMTQQ